TMSRWPCRSAASTSRNSVVVSSDSYGAPITIRKMVWPCIGRSSPVPDHGMGVDEECDRVEIGNRDAGNQLRGHDAEAPAIGVIDVNRRALPQQGVDGGLVVRQMVQVGGPNRQANRGLAASGIEHGVATQEQVGGASDPTERQTGADDVRVL